MTAFSVAFDIGDPTGQHWQRIDALVDTGSTYTWVPREVLAGLGIDPQFRREFQTADGRVVGRDMAAVQSRIDGQSLPTLVVFADEFDATLLGIYTLEGFALGVDPVNERLIPVRSLAMTSFYGAVPRTEATEEVRHLLEGLAPGEGDLLEALHRVQHRYGYVPREAIAPIAQHLRLPPARVYGAITYYSEIRQTPPPETTISWCSGPACSIKGGQGIRLVLETLLACKLGESTDDNRLGLHLGQCNGTCDNAPQVWVNGRVVGPLTASRTVELVRELKGEAKT